MGPRAYSRHSGPEDLKTNPVLPVKLIRKGFPIVLWLEKKKVNYRPSCIVDFTGKINLTSMHSCDSSGS